MKRYSYEEKRRARRAVAKHGVAEASRRTGISMSTLSWWTRPNAKAQDQARRDRQREKVAWLEYRVAALEDRVQQVIKERDHARDLAVAMEQAIYADDGITMVERERSHL